MIDLIKERNKLWPMKADSGSEEYYLELMQVIIDISRSSGHVSMEGYELDYKLCELARAADWHLIQFMAYIDDNKIIEKIK